MHPKILLPALSLALVLVGCTSTATLPAPLRRSPTFTLPYLDTAQVDTEATLVHSTALPNLPALIAAGNSRYAIVDFLVDVDGRIREAQWVEATDAVFGEIAVQNVNEWRYRPALKEGRPVVARGSHQVEFTVLPRIWAPPNAVAVRREPTFTIPYLKPSQVDTLPRLVRRHEPVYPRDFLVAGIKGRAVVQFIVTPDGIPREVQWVEASDVAFGEAAVEAVKMSSYVPARKNGQPVSIRRSQEIVFSVTEG